MEEIEESEDSTDNILNSHSTLPLEGTPSGLTRNIKPGLNSSTKNNKNKEEISEDAFVGSILST